MTERLTKEEIKFLNLCREIDTSTKNKLVKALNKMVMFDVEGTFYNAKGVPLKSSIIINCFIGMLRNGKRIGIVNLSSITKEPRKKETRITETGEKRGEKSIGKRRKRTVSKTKETGLS